MTSIFQPGERPPGRIGFEIALPSSSNGGEVGIVEGRIPAGTAGPPLHIHLKSIEIYFIISGAMLFTLDGELSEVSAGGTVCISRNTPHTWATPRKSDAHFLTMYAPGGYEAYHSAALAAEAKAGGRLTGPDLLEIARDFDWELAGGQLLRLTPGGRLVEAAKADEAAEAEAEAERQGAGRP